MKPEIEILGISIKTFGVMFALGFLACGALVARRLRELGKPVDWSYEIVFSALIGGLIGARGYYVIQNYSQVEHNLLKSLFSGSGLVWYGGAIGGAIGVLLWMRWRDQMELIMFDMCATALALGYAIGRIGCQVSGDGDYGISSKLPWAMGYPARDGSDPAGRDGTADPDLRDRDDVSAGLPAVAHTRQSAPGGGVRAVSRAERVGAIPGRVHPPQQGGVRWLDGAAGGEPRAVRDRARVVGADDT